MGAFSIKVGASAVRSPKTGLRPEPQGVCTQAAGAALKIGAEAKSRASYGKSVFDRHSTQSSIAARLRRAPKRFKALSVDTAVYNVAGAVYPSAPLDAQVPEYALRALSTVTVSDEVAPR
jgi:hypothetical protein